MSSIEPPVIYEYHAAPFPSMDALLDAHDTLIVRRQQNGDAADILDAATHFIYTAQTTGALLDDEADRRVAQGILDYWANTLYRNGYDTPDAILNTYDPSLAPDLLDDECPYVGLNSFQPEQHALFYGRQRLIDQLITLVKRARLVLVIGPSGSGKSSLVLGGLIPQLQQGALPGSASWHYDAQMVPGSNRQDARMVPGSKPLENLARLLCPPDKDRAKWTESLTNGLRQSPDCLASVVNALNKDKQPLVLVVDQFEELFTLCSDEQARHVFSNNLIGLTQAPGPRHTVILTMRSDFESRLGWVPALQKQLEDVQMRVTPPTPGDLRDAITKPAELRGLKIDEDVVDSLVTDIAGDTAALPLLQFALLELWHNKDRNRVTWETYKRVGKAHEALGHSAERLYQSMSVEERRLVKRIFMRLVRPGEQMELDNNRSVVQFREGTEFTSKRIARRELYRTGLGPDEIDPIVKKLSDSGLLRLSPGDMHTDDQIEVAHEALVRNWQTLSDWLDDDRSGLVTRRRYEAKAAEWVRLGRGSGALLDEIQLHDVERWIASTEAMEVGGYDRALDDLIAVSHRALAHAREEAKRKEQAEIDFRKRRPLTNAAEKWHSLKRDSTALWRGKQLQEALGFDNLTRLEDAFLTASVLAERAAKKAKEEAQRRELEQARELLAEQEQRAEAERERAEAESQRAEAESKRAADQTHSARRLRIASFALTIAFMMAVAAAAVAVSYFYAESQLRQKAEQAERTALTDRFSAIAAGATAQVDRGIALAAGATAQVDRAKALAAGATAQIAATRAVSESLLARTAEAAAQKDRESARNSEAIAQKDRQTAEMAATVAHTAQAGAEFAAKTAVADRATAQAAQATAQAAVTAAVAGQAALQIEVATRSAAEEQLRAEEAQRANIVATQLTEAKNNETHQNAQTLALSVPNLVSQGNNQLALLAALAAAERDDTPKIEDALQLAIQANIPNSAVSKHSDGITSITWSPDNKYILTTGTDTVARIWDQFSGKQLRLLRGHTDSLTSAAWSSDNTRIVTTSADGTARIWDAQSGRELYRLAHGISTVTGAAWSPDDSRIVTSSDDGLLHIWESATGKLIKNVLNADETLSRAAWSPDGTAFVTAGNDGTLRVRDGVTGDVQRSFVLSNSSIKSAAWSPSGQFFLVATGEALIVQANDGTLFGKLPVPNGAITNATWSPSGRSILTAGSDGFTRIWNTAQRNELGELTSIAPAPRVVMASWSPDGRRIAVGSADGTMRLYFVQFSDIVAQAQSLKTRDITSDELQRILGGQYVPLATPTATPTNAITP